MNYRQRSAAPASRSGADARDRHVRGEQRAFFKGFGGSDAAEARRLVDVCLEAGLTMFDSADVYSGGLAEETLGAKGPSPGDATRCSSRRRAPSAGPARAERRRLVAVPHLVRAVEAWPAAAGHRLHRPLPAPRLRRAPPPSGRPWAPSTTSSGAGKIRYVGASNFSGWHLMKSLAASEKYGLARYVAHQAYYSLLGREYEWGLMPLALDQRVGTSSCGDPLGLGPAGPGRSAATSRSPRSPASRPKVPRRWAAHRRRARLHRRRRARAGRRGDR